MTTPLVYTLGGIYTVPATVLKEALVYARDHLEDNSNAKFFKEILDDQILNSLFDSVQSVGGIDMGGDFWIVFDKGNALQTILKVQTSTVVDRRFFERTSDPDILSNERCVIPSAQTPDEPKSFNTSACGKRADALADLLQGVLNGPENPEVFGLPLLIRSVEKYLEDHNASPQTGVFRQIRH